MRRASLIIMLLLTLLTLGGMCSNNDSGKKVVGNHEAPPGTCDANASPTLTLIGFQVGTTVVQGEATASRSDSVTLLLAYEDKECNLGGGTLMVYINGGPATETAITGGLACPQETIEGSQLAYSMSLTSTGEMTVEAKVTDLCGAESNALSTILTVTEATGDDTTADDDTAIDDTSAADDDTSDAPRLAGEMRYYGDKTATEVWILVYTHWMPTGLPLFGGAVTVPGDGFPFDYQLDATGVPAGSYFIAAYFDAVEGDGVYNPAIDPTHSPWYSVTLTPGQTTTYNITLVDPGK